MKTRFVNNGNMINANRNPQIIKYLIKLKIIYL